MPAEYNPFADLEAYGADVARRRGNAAAVSASADQAALKFGLQNLEGNQAMSKQKLTNQGILDKQVSQNKGKTDTAYIGQQVDPNLPPAVRAAQLARALAAVNFEKTGKGFHDFRAGGRDVPAGPLTSSEFPMAELSKAVPLVVSGNKALASVQNTNGVTEATQDVVGPNGEQIGFAKPRTTTRTDSTVAKEQNTPPARAQAAAQLRPGATPQQSQANPAQGALDTLKAKGQIHPDAQLTGVVDERGRHQIKDGSGRIGWVSQ